MNESIPTAALLWEAYSGAFLVFMRLLLASVAVVFIVALVLTGVCSREEIKQSRRLPPLRQARIISHTLTWASIPTSRFRLAANLLRGCRLEPSPSSVAATPGPVEPTPLAGAPVGRSMAAR